MDFGVPDWIAQQRICCVNCNKDFVPINEEADNEIRCIDCQTAWRIAGSPGSGKPDNIGWRDWHMFIRPMRSRNR